ncbi:MAG: guanitoxin biosynthesis heme-dependent pre-guanitoxin N-hydroxylase GntA [Brumimicrobium sp.]
MKADIGLKFTDFISNNNHPCLMAQAVFKSQQAVIKEYDKMLSSTTVNGIIKDLKDFLKKYSFEDQEFYSFIAIFSKETIDSEIEFENKLWQLLNCLHVMDKEEWDPSVSKDPTNKEFSFSINGKAFYIVGMHPNSSRLSRQSPYPAIAFNLHVQFVKLRSDGVFKTVRNKIRERDKELQGNINPMLKDFGTDSEVKQYSGRIVNKNWKCPFDSK